MDGGAPFSCQDDTLHDRTYVLGSQRPMFHVPVLDVQRIKFSNLKRRMILRKHLQIRLGGGPPVLHERKVNVGRTNTSPGTKIVRKAGCRRLDDQILGSILNVHGCDRIQRARYDCVGAILRPQLVRPPKQSRKAVEDGVRLLLALGKTAGEPHDGIQVALPQVVDVHETGGVEGNEVAVLGGGVTVGGFGVHATTVEDLRNDSRVDVCGPCREFGRNLLAKVGIKGALG